MVEVADEFASEVTEIGEVVVGRMVVGGLVGVTAGVTAGSGRGVGDCWELTTVLCKKSLHFIREAS